MPNSRKCKYPECQQFFTPKRKSQVYCSAKCREDDYDRVYFHKADVEKTCPNCGNLFQSSKPLIQVFCSPECRTESHTKHTYHAPLEHLEEAIESMNKILTELSVSDASKVSILAKYYCHYLDYTPTEVPQHSNGSCELCDNTQSRLEPYKGISLCARCHIFAEYVDKGMIEHYQELVEQRNIKS